MTTDVDAFLEHYGVPGMKWGKRNASTIAEGLGLTRGKTPRDKQGNIKKPSYVRQLAVGTWANSKKRYTDPGALATRTASGKLALAALLTGAASAGLIGVATLNSRNESILRGSMVVSSVLGKGSSALGVAALATGVVAARQERVARANNG